MERTITPEILDHLHSDDPRAVRSRKDLQLVNRLMGNGQFQSSAIRQLLQNQKNPRILEVGCGDGTFMLEVLRGARLPGGEVVLLDQQDIVLDKTISAFAGIGWKATRVQADLFQWLPQMSRQRFDLGVCNLFLHHFHSEALRKVFAVLAESCHSFIATEPRRNLFCFSVTKCLWVIGCNDVTRHDAPVSVRAGFSRHDLQELWPKEENHFEFQERKQGLFTHYFEAKRKPATSS